MNFLTRFFNGSKKESSTIDAPPKWDSGFLLSRDDYDCYLFECAKKQIQSLHKVIVQANSSGFENFLCDVFAMCYKAEPQWQEHAEQGYNYEALLNLTKAIRWDELRKKTRFNGLQSAMATVAIGREYLKLQQGIEKGDQGEDKTSQMPRFLGVMEGSVTAVVGGNQGRLDSVVVEIERFIDSKGEQLLSWGITPPMMPLDSERVMKLAGLLDRNPEFLQFAEKVGQLRESIVNLGRRKLRQKGVSLRGVSVGNNVMQAVPSELALLSSVESEVIFYDRALGGKLTLYDYAEASRKKRGSMVIVIDGSGSVRGEKGYLIRGIAVALVQLARIEKRWASVIIFGGKNEQQEFVFDPHEKTNADRLVEMATTFYGGGDTVFWKPLELAFERLKTKPFLRGDLVLVTDYIRGSEGPLLKFTEQFAQAKTKLGFRYFSLFLPSTQWVNDLSWHNLADDTISLDHSFFQQDSTTINRFANLL